MSYKLFFNDEVPKMLQALKSDAQRKWGSMTVDEMLDHLRRGIELSIRTDIEVSVITPSEHLPAFKNFLMSDKLFKKSSDKPKEYDLTNSFDGDFNALKENLLESLVKLQTYFDEHPNHINSHPNFGELNTEEWLQLHKKHILHHFTQFGIIQ